MGQAAECFLEDSCLKKVMDLELKYDSFYLGMYCTTIGNAKSLNRCNSRAVISVKSKNHAL